jgi:signal transduction histidine kinase/DNA-binding response OmpR family regulator
LIVTNESVQFEHRQKSGKVVSVIGQHIGDEWLMLTYTDITESKTWALARDKSQLQADAANAAKSEFLANMSHELRTPLNAVIGLSALLAQSPLNRRQIDYAEKIQLSANTLRVLIDDILDLSKIEANELHLELTPFSLNVMMSNVASVLGVGVGKKQIEPVLNIQTHVPDKLRGDVLRLQQILLNLVSNAVKFTEKGEIVLSVRSVPQADASNSTHATFEFEVRDTGMGMTQESQSLIFNEFTQAHESISRLYGGTGLGLAISSRLTKLMDGKLEVHSVLGQGTEFRLTLPILLDTEVAAVAHDVGARAHCDLTILIVDDHPQVRDVLSRSCHQFGWQTHAVDSGAAGLLALTGPDAKYDLVLLDWHMPEMDGLAMLQKVYQCTDFDVPPVILMVAQAEIEQAVIASALFNVDGIIAKPLTSDALLRVVLKSLANDVEQFASPPIASPKVLSGMHLLVVDDNELNQEVMEQILKSAGAQVTLAGNGQLAIDALQASPARFDAVLMDIQMPVMDGYTATRVIRETMGLVDLPILALTAYARPQDRETAKMAGMSGHVAKPLDVQNLLNTLVKLVHERENALPITTTSIQSIDTDFILPGLNLANSFKAFGGDQLGYSRLLHKFVNQQKNRIPEARRLFDNGDREGAIALIHSLSGVSGLLQLNRFSWLARTTESSMLDGKTGNLPVLFEQLEFAMNTVISALDNFDSTAH